MSESGMFSSPGSWQVPTSSAKRQRVVRYSDEEEEEEEAEAPVEAPIIDEAPEMSMFKEGINFGTALNGSDVRVGIIMGRWNADVIQGLYKVSYRVHQSVTLT
jgi:hypothetical protein